MNWISVEERLPSKWQRIIIYIPNFNGVKDFMTITVYVHKDVLLDATHWMPLPEVPNGMD